MNKFVIMITHNLTPRSTTARTDLDGTLGDEAHETDCRGR